MARCPAHLTRVERTAVFSRRAIHKFRAGNITRHHAGLAQSDNIIFRCSMNTRSSAAGWP